MSCLRCCKANECDLPEVGFGEDCDGFQLRRWIRPITHFAGRPCGETTGEIRFWPGEVTCPTCLENYRKKEVVDTER